MANRSTIRIARPDDAAALYAIERAAFPDPWREADFVDVMTAPGVAVWVAVAGHEVVGYIVSRQVGEEAEILNLAVAFDFRRQQLASTLLGHAVSVLERSGVIGIFLEVRSSNLEAKALYRKQGFALVGMRRRYYRKPMEDALVLRRRVSLSQNDPPP